MVKKSHIQRYSKFSFLSLTTSSLFLAACTSETYPTTDVSGISAYAKTQDSQFATAIKNKSLQKLPVTLITAEGRVNDKSFNQSVWEAIGKVSTQAGISNSTYQETNSTSQLGTQYTNALNSGKKLWVLTGFQHHDAFKSWLDVSSNKTAFENSGVVVVSVDWDGNSYIPAGHGIALNYKTQEAAFIVGYAAAKFLSEKYPTEESKRYLSGFGGAPFTGVTNFLAGYLAGGAYFNSSVDSNKTVKFSDDKIVLNTGFRASAANSAVINQLLTIEGKNPQIILPVAGFLTTSTVDAAKNLNRGQLVIGVDSDQSKAFPNLANYFFSSIEKRVGLTVYKSLEALILGQANTSDFLKNDQSHRFYLPNNNEKKNASNVSLFKGFSDKFVAYAPSTVANADDRAKIDADLKEGEAKFNAGYNHNITSEHHPFTNEHWQVAPEYSALDIPTVSDTDTKINNQTVLNEYIKTRLNKVNLSNKNTLNKTSV